MGRVFAGKPVGITRGITQGGKQVLIYLLWSPPKCLLGSSNREINVNPWGKAKLGVQEEQVWQQNPPFPDAFPCRKIPIHILILSHKLCLPHSMCSSGGDSVAVPYQLVKCLISLLSVLSAHGGVCGLWNSEVPILLAVGIIEKSGYSWHVQMSFPKAFNCGKGGV